MLAINSEMYCNIGSYDIQEFVKQNAGIFKFCV